MRRCRPANKSRQMNPSLDSTNPDVEIDLARLTGEHDLARLRLENLERLRGRDDEAGPKLPAARATLADLETQLADRRRDAERLTLIAPAAGTVIPVPNAQPRESPDGRLPKWSGNLLDDQNRGALVEPGTFVCLVGDPHNVSAVLLVDDTERPPAHDRPARAAHSRTSAGRSTHRRSPRRRPPRRRDQRHGMPLPARISLNSSPASHRRAAQKSTIRCESS